MLATFIRETEKAYNLSISDSTRKNARFWVPKTAAYLQNEKEEYYEGDKITLEFAAWFKLDEAIESFERKEQEYRAKNGGGKSSASSSYHPKKDQSAKDPAFKRKSEPVPEPDLSMPKPPTEPPAGKPLVDMETFNHHRTKLYELTQMVADIQANQKAMLHELRNLCELYEGIKNFSYDQYKTIKGQLDITCHAVDKILPQITKTHEPTVPLKITIPAATSPQPPKKTDMSTRP